MKIVVRNTSVLFFNFAEMRRGVKEVDIEEQRTNEGYSVAMRFTWRLVERHGIITIYFIFLWRTQPDLLVSSSKRSHFQGRHPSVQFSMGLVFREVCFLKFWSLHTLTRRFIAPQSFIHFPLSCLFTCDIPNSVFKIEATLGILTERNFIQGTRC